MENNRRMSESQRLQKAVELTIASGFQLNREAFEFLNLVSDNEDPAEIVAAAIQQALKLEDKPLFIERLLLEEIMKTRRPAEEIVSMELETHKPLASVKDAAQAAEFVVTSHPYAKEAESDVKIVDDPGSKISSSGTLEDFLGYFQDRFRQVERLLRQRMDVRSAASVMDAIKATPNTRLKIIGMITDKRDSRQKTVLTVEDLKAVTTVLVPQDAPRDLQRKTQTLLLDQVVCLAVLKTRSGLLIAEDVVFPDVAQKTPRKAPIPVYAVLTSDMHVGSRLFTKAAFHRFILWLNGKFGDSRMREIASHVKYVLIAGDIVDGIGVYPNQAKELAIRDIDRQYALASKYVEQIPDYVEVIVIPGNHDAPRKALPQPAISAAFLETLQESRSIHSMGNPCTLSLHGVEVLMYHGRSLDDVISTVPEMSHAHPERAMRLLLQGRHLAPVYGGKTPISPEGKDYLVIGNTPDIFHAGHVHSIEYGNYRGVLLVNSGCWQEKTDYMRKNGFTPMPAVVPVVNLQTLEVNLLNFS